MIQQPTVNVKTRIHFDERNIPYDSQPEANQSPTHVLGENGELIPFKPSDMDYGANYASI